MDDWDYGAHAIQIDGRWSLEDLYIFPRAYEQVYFALDAVLPTSDEHHEDRVDRAFEAFPWRGGYSAVNFYNQLKYATPPQLRPRILSIQYASPGWLELSLILGHAAALGVIVTAVARTIDRCNRTYNGIMTDLMKRRLLRIEVERARFSLQRDEIELVDKAADAMAKLLNLGSADTVHQRTKKPLISLKILLSLYRRVRTLAEYQVEGKADFRTHQERLLDDGEI